jgi:fibronectin-binding autotransporter adhesin
VSIGFSTPPASLPGGIIGGYATANGTDWATLDGANKVVAYSAYTTNTAPGTWASGQNINLTAGGLVSVTAPTTINSLRLSDASTNLNIAAGQSLNIGTGGLLTATLPLQTISGPGSLTAGSGAAELIANVANGSSTLSISAPIVDNGTGAVKLVKAGPGKLILSGSGSTYTGGTDLIGGTLQVGSANFFPVGSNLTVNYGTAFDIGGFNQTFGTVAVIDGSVLNSGGAASVTATAYDVRNGTITAALAGTGALTKTSSTGTITLSGATPIPAEPSSAPAPSSPARRTRCRPAARSPSTAAARSISARSISRLAPSSSATRRPTPARSPARPGSSPARPGIFRTARSAPISPARPV